jgi:catechol 2,3-dioxygenase-like lactoylglutathione lyase family enzyme
MIRGIHHTALSIRNLEASLHFYRDILGFEEVFRFSWEGENEAISKIVQLRNSCARGAFLRTANTYIELFEYSNPTPQGPAGERRVCDYGYTHICLDVLDIDSEYERLSRAGMKFHCPPQFEGEVRTTYGRDPDGNVIELQELQKTAAHYLVLGERDR